MLKRLTIITLSCIIATAVHHAAQADALWAKIDGNQLQVKLASAPYEKGIEPDLVQKSIVTANGKTLTLERQKDKLYSTAALQPNIDVVAVSNNWGKLKSAEPDHHEFSLHYYAKTARNLKDANTTTSQGAQWYIKQVEESKQNGTSATWDEGMPVVARLVEGGYPVAGASVMIYVSEVIAFPTFTDETGKVFFRIPEGGLFSLQASWGSFGENHQSLLYPYDLKTSERVRNYATLTFAIPKAAPGKFQEKNPQPTGTIQSQVSVMRFSQNSKKLISAGILSVDGKLRKSSEFWWAQDEKIWDKRLRVWNVGTGEQIWRLPAAPVDPGNTEIMPDFKTMFTWGNGGYNQIDIHSFHFGKLLKNDSGFRSSIKLSPDGKLFAIGATRHVYIVDAKTLKTLRIYNHGAQGTDVFWGPHSKTILCKWGYWGLYNIRYQTNKPQVIDVATVKQILYPRWFYLLRGSDAFTFSPNGNFLAKAKGQTVEIWETPTSASAGKKLNTFATSLDIVRVLQFSPNGKTLAVGGSSKTEVPVQFITLSQVRK